MQEERIISSKVQGGEDTALDLSLRPKVLSEYMGQAKVKQNLEIFMVYVDKAPPGNGKESCGGFLGLVAHNHSMLKNNLGFSVFGDGEVRAVKHLPESGFGGPPVGDGILCNSLWKSYHCCFDAFKSHMFPGLGPVCSLSCKESSALPSVGSKFSEDLVIIYKGFDSSILHERSGRLTAQVEKP